MKKRVILSILALIMGWNGIVASEKIGDLYYFLSNDGTAEVIQSPNGYSGDIVIPASVTSINGTTYHVTNIGNDAFSGCGDITSITIPDGVTSIESHAFAYCHSLVSITIPNSVTTIDRGAFYYCTSLGSIVIPASVTRINECGYVFTYCNNLTSIVVESGNTVYDSRDNCNAIIETTTNNLVRGCNVTTIPNSVTQIGKCAFYGCDFSSIVIPNSITSIGFRAFEDCKNLTSITIPDGVTSIGEEAFLDCTSLTSVTIPNSVTSIGENAFKDTPWYTSKEEGPIYIGSVLYAYKGEMPQNTNLVVKDGTVSITPWALTDCKGLTSITIPSSIKSIRNNAFTGCSKLTSVVWNAKNANGGREDGPFYNSRSQITSFTFGDDVDTIPDNLCYGMDKLSTITIPQGVMRIGDNAFDGCTGLTSCTLLQETPLSLGYWVFGDNPSFPFYIPCGATEVYNGAWGRWGYTNFIEPSPQYSLTVASQDTEKGKVSLVQQNTCNNDTAVIQATANKGYRFARWSDGSTDNPRTLTITRDSAITAIFDALPKYTVLVGVASGCKGMGSVTGSGIFPSDEYAVISATPNKGYHFVEWSDGIGGAKRCIYLTSDTTLFATFAQGDYAGKCGENLYWECENGALTITGSGDMDLATYHAWNQYDIDIASVSFPEGMTYISPKAFIGRSSNTDMIPSQDYLRQLQKDGQFIVCIRFLSTVCNDVVWTGPYNNWQSNLDSLLYFQQVPGYADWYYVNVPLSDDIVEGSEIGKPVQLKNDGSFDWDYQSGDANSWILVSGYVNIASSYYDNESRLLDYYYGNGPLVLVLKNFKHTPCANSTTTEFVLPQTTPYSLQRVVIPASVTGIGAEAFAGCPDLRHFEYLGNSLETGASILLSNYMAYIRANTYTVYAVAIADTVAVSNGYVDTEYLPKSAYYDLRGASNWDITMNNRNTLRVLYLPDGLKWINDFSFANNRHLESIIIPEKVSSIGESAFEDCRSLQSVTFAGKQVETIEDWAFYNCHELQSITIPEGVKEIGKSAFYGCTYLSELTLPSTVESIDDNGFASCGKLRKISVGAMTPPVIDAKTFEDVDRSIPLCVPVGTRNDYANAPYWQEFFNIQEVLPIPSAADEVRTQDNAQVQKVFRDGQVYILRGGKMYTLTGEEVK